jgi:hypothetical protein
MYVPQNVSQMVPPLPTPPAPEPTKNGGMTMIQLIICLWVVMCQKEWHIRTLVGDLLGPGSDGRKDRSRLDYFLLIFSPDQLTVIVTLTSEQLISIDKPTTTAGKILKFFGVLV